MNRINLKIRPVSDWFVNMLDKESPMYDATSIKDFKQIAPTFFKENFYLLTENGKKRVWLEAKTDDGFIAIESTVDAFEHGLNEDDYLKTPEKVIVALRNIHKLDPKILTDKQSNLVWRYDWMMEQIHSLRKTRLSWQKWIIEDEKEFGNE